MDKTAFKATLDRLKTPALPLSYFLDRNNLDTLCIPNAGGAAQTVHSPHCDSDDSGEEEADKWIEDHREIFKKFGFAFSIPAVSPTAPSQQKCLTARHQSLIDFDNLALPVPESVDLDHLRDLSQSLHRASWSRKCSRRPGQIKLGVVPTLTPNARIWSRHSQVELTCSELMRIQYVPADLFMHSLGIFTPPQLCRLIPTRIPDHSYLTFGSIHLIAGLILV